MDASEAERADAPVMTAKVEHDQTSRRPLSAMPKSEKASAKNLLPHDKCQVGLSRLARLGIAKGATPRSVRLTISRQRKAGTGDTR